MKFSAPTVLGALISDTSGPHRSPGQDRWPSSAIPQAPDSGGRRLTTTLRPRYGIGALIDGLVQRPKGAVCKTVGFAYPGSNPGPATTSENGPLAVNSRLGGPFPSCHAPYHDVSP